MQPYHDITSINNPSMRFIAICVCARTAYAITSISIFVFSLKYYCTAPAVLPPPVCGQC